MSRSRPGVAREVMRDAVRHVGLHPLRSALTAATSAVAIAVTVNVVSLVYGMDEDLRRDVARFGRTTIDVGRFPKLRVGGEREPLGPAELEKVRASLEGLGAALTPRRQAAGRATGDVEMPSVQVAAVPVNYLASVEVRPVAGRWLVDGDDPAGVCVLDASAAATLFPGRSPADVVGRTVRLAAGGSHDRRVVGVLEDPFSYRDLFEAFDAGRGTRTLTSSLLSHRNVYLPAGALPGEDLSGITIRLPDEAAVREAARRLRVLWPNAEGDPLFPKGTIGVLVRAEWMDLVGATSQTGALLGNIVWIIVVFVAVVMLSTLNLLVVRERYDEIAVRRCEGARRSDVALQVTVEGVLVALAGGVAGLPLGLVGAAVMREIVQFPFRFDLRWAGLATVVAALLGLLASVLPARRAARLEPAGVLTRRLT